MFMPSPLTVQRHCSELFPKMAMARGICNARGCTRQGEPPGVQLVLSHMHTVHVYPVIERNAICELID